jgi:hypothetical protein
VVQVLQGPELLLEPQQGVAARLPQGLERDAHVALAVEGLVDLTGATRAEPADEDESIGAPERGDVVHPAPW